MRPLTEGSLPTRRRTACKWTAALALAGLMLVATSAAADTGWSDWPSRPPANLSNSDIDQARRPAIVAGPPGRLLVVWRDQPLGGGEDGWLYARTTQDDGETWSQTETITITTDEIFPPDGLSVEGQFLVTWAQRAVPGDRVVVYEARKGADRWTIHPIPGPNSDAPTRPHLTVAGGQLHLIFSANRSPGDPTDLFHTSRPLTATEWPTATVFFTHTAFLGGSQFPAVVAGSDGATLHLVWEEKQSAVERTILYMSGTVTASGTVIWSPPVTLSEGITLSVNPAIAAGATGDLHVVWGENADQGQYVRYVRYDATEGRWLLPSVRVSDVPMLLNQIDPADLTPHVAVFEGSQTQVCITWHGFRESDPPPGAEEIWVSCSTDGGKTWSTPRNVSRSPDAVSIMPWTTFDDQGRLHVVWEERIRSEETDTYYEIFYTRGFNRSVFLPLVLRGWP